MFGKQRLTRRRIAALSGATLALGAGGLSMVPRTAQAQVSGEFNIPDQTLKPEDNQLAAVFATVSGDWSYANLDAEAAEWRTYLLVDDPQQSGSWEAIGMTSGSASAREATGVYGLRGQITAASHYDASTFDVTDGTPKSIDIPLSVLFMVMDSAGDTLASAEAMDTPAVGVEPGGAISDVTGTGSVHGVDDAGDPTPTVPSGGA